MYHSSTPTLVLFIALHLTTTTATDPASRYIATNRFQVRNAPGFEQRWANRKSRLATLDGFRYFTLLRRTQPPDFFKEMVVDSKAPDYVSCTLWEDRDCYKAWRKGDAFKEAHGGKGGISAIASMIKTAIFLLKGKPKPALYDASKVVAGKPSPSIRVEGGWRTDISADGKSLLEPECFAVINQWPVVEDAVKKFETAMALGVTDDVPKGLKVRTLLKRDGEIDDGFSHSWLSIWDSEDSFNKWRESQPRADRIRTMMADNVISGPPSPLFFEGLLCLESRKGA